MSPYSLKWHLRNLYSHFIDGAMTVTMQGYLRQILQVIVSAQNPLKATLLGNYPTIAIQVSNVPFY